MPDIVYTTVKLNPAFIGEPYEGSVSYKSAATVFTAQSIVQTGALSGLPAGLAMDVVGSAPGSLRFTGTPTGLASAGNTPLTGPGAYTFQVSGTDTAGAVVSATLTLSLYSSRLDQQFLQATTTVNNVAHLSMGG